VEAGELSTVEPGSCSRFAATIVASHLVAKIPVSSGRWPAPPEL